MNVSEAVNLFDVYTDIVHTSFVGINCVLGLFIMGSNLSFIIAFVNAPVLRTIDNAFLVKMSIFDCSVGLSVIMMSIGRVVNAYAYYYCFVAENLFSFSLGGSSLSILAVTIERYIKVRFPFDYERFKTQRILKTCVLSEMLALVSADLGNGYIRYTTYEGSSGKCTAQSLVQGSNLVRFTFLAAIVILLGISSALYIHMAIISRRHRRAIRAQQMNTPMVSSMEKRKVNMIGIVLAVQYLSFFPSLLRGFIEDMADDGSINKVIIAEVLLELCDSGIFASSLLNPLVYPLRCTDIKREINRIFCRTDHGQR